MALHFRQHASGLADATGSISMSFPAPNEGTEWLAVVSVPASPGNLSWSIAIGPSASSGLLAGAMQGPSSYGQIKLSPGEVLTLSATGIQAGTVLNAVMETSVYQGQAPLPTLRNPSSVQIATTAGQLVFGNEVISAGTTYTDTVLAGLPGIYHSLQFALTPSASGTVTLRLYDSSPAAKAAHAGAEIQMWRIDLSTLATSEVNPYWVPICPSGGPAMNLSLTVENSTSADCHVSVWAWPDEVSAAVTTSGGSAPARAAPAVGQTSVGTAATTVSGGGTNRAAITVYNPSANADAVYLGWSSGVTTGDGYELDPGYGLTMTAQRQLYAIAAAATTVSWEDE